jgi:hypothetical protein
MEMTSGEFHRMAICLPGIVPEPPAILQVLAPKRAGRRLSQVICASSTLSVEGVRRRLRMTLLLPVERRLEACLSLVICAGSILPEELLLGVVLPKRIRQPLSRVICLSSPLAEEAAPRAQPRVVL